MPTLSITTRAFTDDELRAAWQQRRRAHWPPSFDDAMADPLYLRLIRIEANLRAHRALLAEQRAAMRRERASTRAFSPAPRGGIDHKRLAAGERDDD